MPRNSGGRPRHNLTAYIKLLKKNDAGGKDRQCICIACAEVLKDNAVPIVNKKPRIKKHLENCEHFWKKYGQEAAEILQDCDDDEEIPPAKRIHIDG
jgi:hypothetical protein